MSIKATIQGGAGINASVTTKQLSVAPSGWDDQVAEYGRGYNYPLPTGQVTGFRTGDATDIETTIFAPVRVANSLKVQNSLTDFLTLGNTNSFGNTSRFTDVDGLQVYGNKYIIDNYTGLGWFGEVKAVNAADWNACIDDALTDTDASFSDWFLPNRKQLESITRYERITSIRNFFDYAPFDTFGSLSFSGADYLLVTSNTATINTSSVFYVRSQTDQILNAAKTLANAWDRTICRKHF